MSQSLARNLIYLIFSTKHRERVLNDTIRPSFHGYVVTVLNNLRSPVLAVNSERDHVHVLFVLHRTLPLSKVVEDLKRSSSKWLKGQSQELVRFSWQAGYGAFSVSESNVPVVKEYVANQAEHHRTVSFEEELRGFLRKHGVEFDERYLWE